MRENPTFHTFPHEKMAAPRAPPAAGAPSPRSPSGRADKDATLRGLAGRAMAHAAAHIDENLYAYRSLITLGALLPVAYHARRTWQHTLRRYTCASQLRRRVPVLMGNQQQQLQLQQQQAEHAVAFRGRVTGLGWWGNNSNSGNDGGCSGRPSGCSVCTT